MSYTDETKLKVQRLKEAEQQQVRMQQEQKRRAYVQKAHLEEFRRSQRTKAIAAKQTEATGKSGNGNGKLLKVNKGIVTVVRANHAIASNEKSRVQTVREVIKAAIKIQRAYRRYRERRLNQQQQPVTRVKPKPPPIGIRSLRGGVGGGGGGGDSTTTVATTVTTTNTKKEILRARAPPPTNISPSSKKPQQQSQSQQLLQQQQSQQSLQSPKPPLGKSLSFQQTNANALGTRNSPRRASLGAAPTTAAPTAAPTTNATNGVGALTTIQQEHDHLQNHDHSGQGCKHKGCKGVYPTYRPFKATPAPKVRSQVVASSPPPKEHENPNAIAQALGYK